MKTSMKESISAWFWHTKQYYASLTLLWWAKGMAACICLVTVFACTIFVRADVATWVLDDVLEPDITMGDHYSYMQTSEAPPLSSNRHYLTMPMTVQDYLDPSLYDPLLEALPMIAEPDFIDPDLIEMWGDEELQQVEEDTPEFIESRPPRAVVN